jgi:hypothetical protein
VKVRKGSNRSTARSLRREGKEEGQSAKGKGKGEKPSLSSRFALLFALPPRQFES